MILDHALPEPNKPAAEHSAILQSVIANRIQAAGGGISFADYMHTALYEPGLGYYMAGAAKFGETGDFITAPETSSLFGQSIACQAAQVLDCVQGAILELGAGTGKLALSIIDSLHERTDLTYFILEPSADLAQRQQQLLESRLPASAMSRVKWLTQLPDSFEGIVLANEVMDALPVERFSSLDGQVMQLCVTENLSVESRLAPASLTEAVVAIEADLGRVFDPDYTSELSGYLPAWLGSLASMLTRGVLLLIDYGYPRHEFYSPERNNGTLTCYYRHRAHDDPFFWPGLQDITAHVDFTAVAEAALKHELELLGYAPQSAFLLDNHLLDLAEAHRAQAQSETDLISVSKEVKTLTLPGEMGERFQVMALGKGYDYPLQGFSTLDLTHRL